MKYALHYVFSALFSLSLVHAECHGKLLNPITDVCWSCIFPITIGGMKIMDKGKEDTPNPRKIICTCPKKPVPQVGVPVSFWEPIRVVETTRTPWCLMTLGGVQVMQTGPQLHGTVKHNRNRRMRSSSYNVHYITYPVLNIIGALMDWACLENSGASDINIWFSELEASWMDDETHMLMHPESLAFANPIAQAACAIDCVTASTGFAQDAMPWCSGCQGSMYPMSGSVGSHVGGVQASLLTTSRIVGKMHRVLREKITSGDSALCQPHYSPVLKKSQYKTQMSYPKPNVSGSQTCNPLGRSSALWASGRSFPHTGEDFSYILWRKRNCCFG